jgi:hypothetical protein
MGKSLYNLEPNDLFITEKINDVIVYSIVSDIIKNNYVVKVECLARPKQKLILAYNFNGRYYDPKTWFDPHKPHTIKYGHKEDKRSIFKMLFDYELDTRHWEES